MNIIVYCSHTETTKLFRRFKPFLEEQSALGVHAELLDYHFSNGKENREIVLKKIKAAEVVILVSSLDLWDDQFVFSDVVPLIRSDALIILINYRAIEIPDIFQTVPLLPETKAIMTFSGKQDDLWMNIRSQLSSLVLTRKGEITMTGMSGGSFREKNRKKAEEIRTAEAQQRAHLNASALVGKIDSAIETALGYLSNAQRYNKDTCAVVTDQLSIASLDYDSSSDIRYWFVNRFGYSEAVKAFKSLWNSDSLVWKSLIEDIPEPVYDVLERIGKPPLKRDRDYWLRVLGPVPLALYDYLHNEEGYIVYPLFNAGKYGWEVSLFAVDPDDR